VIDAFVYPAMGLLALGVLWLNTLLIAGAALQQRRELGRELSAIRDALTAGTLRRAMVKRGDGPDGVVLTRTVHQMGRAMTVTGPDRILFTEARVEIDVHGGALEVEGTVVEIVAGDEAGRVWLAPDTTLVRAITDFEDAFRAASTTRGLTTFSEQRVGVGTAVWHQPGVLLSLRDPSALIGERMRGLLAFAIVSIVLCAGITAVIFVPPVFGMVSTVGGALGLLFFVLIQPAGVRVRNWARLPDQQPTTATWQRASRP
jgi:hypothetical protein